MRTARNVKQVSETTRRLQVYAWLRWACTRWEIRE